MSDSEKHPREVAPPTGAMSAAEFRRFGHEIVDWIANYFEHIEELPVLARVEPGDLKAQLPSSPPEKGESMAAILADVDRLIVVDGGKVVADGPKATVLDALMKGRITAAKV